MQAKRDRAAGDRKGKYSRKQRVRVVIANHDGWKSIACEMAVLETTGAGSEATFLQFVLRVLRLRISAGPFLWCEGQILDEWLFSTRLLKRCCSDETEDVVSSILRNRTLKKMR